MSRRLDNVGGRTQRGMSLIELMIAILIGAILLVGLVQVFSASRTAYQLSQSVARNQENARFALDFLTRDIRMAGHAGCVNDQSLLSTDSAGKVTGGNIRMTFLTQAQRDANDLATLQYPLRFDVSIQGYEANGTAPGDTLTVASTPAAGATNDWTPALPTELQGLGAVKGSDIIVLRYFAPEQTTVTAMTPTSAPTALGYPDESASTNSKVASGGTSGLYAIANCSSASVFQASSAPTATQMTVAAGSGLNVLGLGATAASANTKVTENYSYAPNQTWLYRAETMAYYVKVGADGVTPALYRTRWTYAAGTATRVAVSDEMVTGVESMQLLYGRDSAALTDTFATGYINKTDLASTLGEATTDATRALSWRRVGNVQLGLLIRGTNDRAATAQSTQLPRVLNVKMTTPDDGNYRTSYETTIALRNRLFGN